MQETRIAIWDAIIEKSREMMNDDESLVMYKDSEEIFSENFNYYHSLIVDKFMKLKDGNLDRHKVAAVIICSILKTDILGIARSEDCSQQTVDTIFLANEKLALDIALSYMYQMLFSEYEDKKVPYDKIFSDFTFPQPLSCERLYTEVICRDLFFSKKYFELNPLSIANFLFLLEAYSFEVSNISINDEKLKQLNEAHHKIQYEKELKQIELALSVFDEKVKSEKQALKAKKTQLEEFLHATTSEKKEEKKENE